MEDATRLRRTGAARGAIACLFALAVAAAHAEEPRFAATARKLLDDAHAMAAASRHGRAVTCALAAIHLDPRLERELALLLANQLTWSDRPEDAIPWYRKHLEYFPGDCDGSLGLARALSWTGRLDEAGEVYLSLGEDCDGSAGKLGAARMDAWGGEAGSAADGYGEVLGADPDSREAALGLADAENARGRHRHAERIYRELLEKDPSDDAARTGLARAQYWMGRHDLALETLAPSDDADADALRGVILDEGRLRVEAEGSSYTDRDDQDLESLVFAASRGVGRQGGARVEIVRATTREPGSADVRVLRGSAGGRGRPSAALALHAYLGAMLPSADATVPAGEDEVRSPAEIEETRVLWDAWATWTPADWTRFDLSWSRVPIETPKSLARAVRIDLLSLAGERRFVDQLVLRANASFGDYTDGNRRAAFLAEVEAGPLRVAQPVAFRIGAGGSFLSYDEELDHGYYSPDRYDAFWGLAGLVAQLGGGVRLDAQSRVGSERENDAERFGVWANTADLVWRRGAVEIGLFWRNSTSRFDTSAGYGREGWGLFVALVP